VVPLRAHPRRTHALHPPQTGLGSSGVGHAAVDMSCVSAPSLICFLLIATTSKQLLATDTAMAIRTQTTTDTPSPLTATSMLCCKAAVFALLASTRFVRSVRARRV